MFIDRVPCSILTFVLDGFFDFVVTVLTECGIFGCPFDPSGAGFFDTVGWPDPSPAIAERPDLFDRDESIVMVSNQYCARLQAFRWKPGTLVELWRHNLVENFEKPLLQSSLAALNSGTIMDAEGGSHPFSKTLVASMLPDGTDFRIIGAGTGPRICSWTPTSPP